MNNRRIRLTADFIEQYSLSVSPPPPTSFFFTLWNANIQTANSALNTPYIQGIKNGTLDPVKYGAFTVSDAYYCYEGAQDYLNAASQAADPVLKAFLLKKYDSYNKYNQTFTGIWHLRDASGIVPLPATLAYADFEQNVASHQDSIYTLITMLPCEYLWYWLASQIAPPAAGNLYAPWITGNDYSDGPYTMGNFIDQYMLTNPIDTNLAMSLYSQAMTFELQNFIAATD